MLINISIHIQDRTNKAIIQDNKRKFFILFYEQDSVLYRINIFKINLVFGSKESDKKWPLRLWPTETVKERRYTIFSNGKVEIIKEVVFKKFLEQQIKIIESTETNEGKP